MKFSDLRLGPKLGGAFFAVVLLTAVVGAFSISKISLINDNTKSLATDWMPSVEAVIGLRSNLVEFRLSEAQHFLSENFDEYAEQEKRMLEVKAKFAAGLQKYQPMISSPEERALADELKAKSEAYFAATAKMVEMSRDPSKAGATKQFFRETSRAALLAALPTAEKLVALNKTGATAAYAQAQDTYAQTRAWVLGLVLAAMAVASLLAWRVTRLVTGPISRAVDVADRIAAGDLTSDTQVEGKDEIAQLLNSLSAMQRKLNGIVSSVRQNAEGVATASAQIASGNNDLSGRTEAQASALEETAASMEELSSTVKQNADNARQANQLAQGASTVAVRGGEVVSEVVETMKDINASSKKITDIIAVIDGIAFQTNILALNAAVEAARAGEQGRGFAVVAAEVRSLAQRSAEAAKEIKSLISASVERVEQGTTLVDQAGATMQEVVSSIRRVTDIMGEISAASVEQSAGVAQVGQAVTQMDQATQQNAALVEESAAAAESLRSQAQQLVSEVAVFKLAGIAHAVHAAPVAFTATSAPAVRRTPAAAAKASSSFKGVERRGPDRAKNVARLPSAKAPAPKAPKAPEPVLSTPSKTGTDDWESF
jgi:methyl-accepting chemotaxis protein